MIQLRAPYEPRPIRFLELWQDSGWRIKVYGISHCREVPPWELVRAAKTVARRCLPHPPVGPNRYGVGFIGVHEGRGKNFIFIDWWVDENELQHHGFESPTDRPDALSEIPVGSAIACVWDLGVLSFERQAWVDTVLANPNGSDLDAYLARRLNTDL